MASRRQRRPVSAQAATRPRASRHVLVAELLVQRQAHSCSRRSPRATTRSTPRPRASSWTAVHERATRATPSLGGNRRRLRRSRHPRRGRRGSRAPTRSARRGRATREASRSRSKVVVDQPQRSRVERERDGIALVGGVEECGELLVREPAGGTELEPGHDGEGSPVWRREAPPHRCDGSGLRRRPCSSSRP